MRGLVSLLFILLFVGNLYAFTGNDSDGMMDAWESKYALNDPNGDEDGDGLTNLQEFIRQSVPTVKEMVGSNLVKIKNIDTDGATYSITSFGEYILIADYSGGLKIYDKDYNFVHLLKIIYQG